MIKCRARQWGNSIGIILPKRVVEENNIKPYEEIVIEVKGKAGNVLRELYGSIKFSKPTRQLLKEARKDLESKY